METENYYNWFKLEAECRRRTNKLASQYYIKNKDLFDEYVKEAFKKTRDASRIYDVPREARICLIEAKFIKDGLITLQVQLMDSEKKLYMCAFIVSIDELELYKKLKNK